MRLSRRIWWVLTSIVLVLAIGFCLWWARDLLGRQAVLGPGQTYTDPLGVSYTVLAREEVTEIGDGYDLHRPVAGATLLRYVVQIDNYVFLEGDPNAGICVFDLVTSSGAAWEATRTFDVSRPSSCESEAPYPSSQQVYPVFEVPIEMVDQIVGLTYSYAPGHSFPVLRLGEG